MSLHKPYKLEAVPHIGLGAESPLVTPSPGILAALLEARIDCETVLAQEFSAIAELPKAQQHVIIERLGSLITTIARRYSPLEPEANALSFVALDWMKSSELPDQTTLANEFSAYAERSPLLVPLCGYLSRLLNWRRYFETLADVHAGNETPEEFLSRNELGYALGSGYEIQITPLFIRVMNAAPGPEDSEGLMGNAPIHAPVILIAGDASDEQTLITDAHEAIHLKVRKDPTFDLPCPFKFLLGSLLNEGFVGKVALGVAPQDVPKNTPSLERLSGNSLLDLMREEFAAQAAAGMGTLMLRNEANAGSLSSILGSADVCENVTDSTWLFAASNTETATLLSLGVFFQAVWVTLFEASAGAGGISASHATTTKSSLPPKALSLLLDLSSSARRALLGIREGARIAEKAGGSLDERYRALILALQPSEYHQIPELLKHKT